MKFTLFISLAALAPAAASAQEVALAGRSIAEVATTLKPGQFAWAPDSAPQGTALLIVNLQTQRAVLFRDGVPIGVSTVSSGKEGYETPTGVFTILEKKKEHYSKTYNNAPMPNMQRLTWKGVALHAGNLPGYPASHGCIRLPAKFSALLFGATKTGMTVVITSLPSVPTDSAAPQIATLPAPSAESLGQAPFEWHPERSPSGIVSVIVSRADQRAIVLRGGVEIGSAPVRVAGAESGAWAYVLRAWDNSGQHWVKLHTAGQGQGMDVAADEGRRFETPIAFRRSIATVLRPGSTIIVTSEPISAGSTGSETTVIAAEGGN